MTIANGCFAASCMIAEHMARQCHSQRDLHLSSKLVDAIEFEIGIKPVDMLNKACEDLMMKE